MKVFRLAGTVLKSLASRPATRLYPYAKREPFARTRGRIAIEIDACIHCGICMRRCPTQAIDVDKAALTWGIERLRCIQCNSCVELCPTKCLSMETAMPDATFGSDYVQSTAKPKPPKPAPAPKAEAAAAPAPAPAEKPDAPAGSADAPAP
jgi:ech hydrogenase subunit F